MSRLKFYDEDHRYELDGVEIPSVSEISRFASREVYTNDISKYTLDNAKERGTTVHKATELLDTVGKCEIAPEYSGYINSYISFRQDFNIKSYLFIEKSIADDNAENSYAGTLDRVYEIDEDFIKAVKKYCRVDISDKLGQLAIIDLKTSSTVQKVLAQIQLPAYANLIETNKIGYVGLVGILHLKNNGKYKLYPYDTNMELFNACLILHKAFIKKSKGRVKNGKS